MPSLDPTKWTDIFLFPDEELEHWFDLNVQEYSIVVKFDEIQNNTNN